MRGLTALSKLPLASKPLYQKLFLNFLENMDLGCLCLRLPSGEELKFGSKKNFSIDQIARIEVLSPEFFKRCILFGDIGFGESYTQGEWETDSITKVIEWMILNWEKNPGISGSLVSNFTLGILRSINRLIHLMRDNSQSGSIKNISSHYDLSNKLFETFLDSSMTYSCADFSQESLEFKKKLPVPSSVSLEDAQIAKFERLARSIQIKPGDSILEIGGGWGAFAIYLAQKYNCKVTTITLSQEQLRKINERIQEQALEGQVEARFEDYRNIKGSYDKVVSIEMLEAVGHKHLRDFFKSVDRVLKPTGVLGIQVITCADFRYEKLRTAVDWIQKHIFPGSLIPSITALTQAATESSRLQLHCLYNMGTDYARTLQEWHNRFNKKLPKVRELGFDEAFIRSWNYYFCYCAAAFRSRHISAVHMVYTRSNNCSII